MMQSRKVPIHESADRSAGSSPAAFVNPERLFDSFREMTEIDAPSFRERAFCDYLKKQLAGLGISAEEDQAGASLCGNCGNLYAFVPASETVGPEKGLPPVLLSMHMDTVDPACGKKAVRHPDGTITSDGTTVLGADDHAGIAAVLEVLRILKENNMPHRPLELLFSAAEEPYCRGSHAFDFSRLKSKEAYVFDLDGPVGTASQKAPTILSFCAVFHGRTAHAAFSPEKGIHAIKAAADAVSHVSCGRVGSTTVNIGTIHGGTADNVVADTCTVTGEVRSFSDDDAKAMCGAVEEQFRTAAESDGASVTFGHTDLCTACQTPESAPVVKRFLRACRKAGLAGTLTQTYGGSDNNVFMQHGITGIVAAAGMNNCHSRSEYTSLGELTRAADMILQLISDPDAE